MNAILSKSLRLRYLNLLGCNISITCGDGWYDLIDILCCGIEHYQDSAGVSLVSIKEIKECHGGLVYVSATEDPFILGMINHCQLMSYRVCERCGWRAIPSALDLGMKTYCENCIGTRRTSEKEH